MKQVFIVLTLLFLQLCICVNAYSEYIFKKDGSIIKGVIIHDAPSYVIIRDETGRKVNIPRKSVMRVLFSELYMGKVYVRLTTGEVLEGYQVDEDRDDYYFRKEINNPSEFKISRKKVMFIARTNPTDLTSEASVERILIRWSPPFKPAKFYRVYLRKNIKGEKFTAIGETEENSFNIRELDKCTGYEVYVTAISDSGEESLPSEKIITNTVPVSPSEPVLEEKYSDDGRTVTLTLKWKPVIDADSRVKSYAIYKAGSERKKLGNASGTEFVIRGFPAEGKHIFAVVSVNEYGVESSDTEIVYDAGYRFFYRFSLLYLVPNGDLAVVAEPGYGFLAGVSAGRRSFSAGFETGYLSFGGADRDIKKMSVVPFLFLADYRQPLFFRIIARPVIKAGIGYHMIEYLRHPVSNPSDTYVREKSEFNPVISAGCFIESGLIEGVSVFGGAEYYSIFQSSGNMYFTGYSAGATLIF
ncbi:MAG TPA: fibronectin type III domain-containing protein [Spirochaetota bacterium]|nr:fibronectin type III domain-containing protein [Spirochaetota bacterium]HPF05719.1 fibronectin type III domain-containing protein [Spirochaetota bacterium]HPJ43813.1 fibronectin type III domain-containing protein [Spirochaetota bacterium]HRX47418.1 fibronectin type III domain-containing protein [Spirochaetota bacterium]